ncbi:hypothetical protein [Agromyces larvae]|uniref:Integrase n=1 Tax=Agromyces larvae TaxID=2929802 RepID=A0ABY4C4P9_9MICO|nr:hypothetical protein [Agromyces larvae]UOE45944.1 hypothetical protein MTO99_09445 [Agromyces larvae]
MSKRANRRITTGPVTHDYRPNPRSSYWATYTLYRNGRRIYTVPHGIIWQAR